jgi:hypothetical protein
MLIDNLMPVYDLMIRQERVIAAPQRRVWQAARAMTIRKLLHVRALLWIREFGSRLRGLPLETFPVVAEKEGTEVVMAICGKFWAITGNIVDVPVEAIPLYRAQGYAKAYWNFHLESIGVGQTRIVSETRVQVYGKRELKLFNLYWRVVGPFTGWIRREILRAIERESLVHL